MPVPRHEEEELRRIAREHFPYEVGMLGATGAMLVLGLPLAVEAQWRAAVANMALESFSLHAQGLTRFFFPAVLILPADVTADDFAPGWREAHPRVPLTLEHARRQAYRLATPLTTERLQRDPRWDLLAVIRTLAGHLKAFRAALPPERLAWFPASTWKLVVPRAPDSWAPTSAAERRTPLPGD